MCPGDPDSYHGLPSMFMPDYDEIHISVTFTWDIKRGHFLKEQWRDYGKKILIGGPAFGNQEDNFVPGKYLKKGIVITSRGCNNNCNFCMVPKKEDKLREIKINEGHIINDNNLLQCSKKHLRKVFDMLKKQKAIEFKGGLQADLITDKIVEELRGLRIKELWLACDTNSSLKNLRKAFQKLTKYFNRKKLRCYVLIGKNWGEENYRLREVYKIGFLPFAQLYQPENRIKYSRVWRDFARRWSRPAIIKHLV